MAPKTVPTVAPEVQPLTDEQLAIVRKAVAQSYRPISSFAELLDQINDSVTAHLIGEILDILQQAADHRLDDALATELLMAGVSHV